MFARILAPDLPAPVGSRTMESPTAKPQPLGEPDESSCCAAAAAAVEASQQFATFGIVSLWLESTWAVAAANNCSHNCLPQHSLLCKLDLLASRERAIERPPTRRLRPLALSKRD